jgi:alpha-N-arabinofuranosidase
MSEFERRAFLASIAQAGAFAAGGSWLQAIGYMQAGRGVARAFLRRSPGRADFDRRVLGSSWSISAAPFTRACTSRRLPSPMPRAFAPTSREVKELGVPIIRYPGGNFVSGHNWLDGVGPKAQRPIVLDRAWNSLETNQFGTNEFIEWCGEVGAEPLLGMNFGTGTVKMAVAYVEYCNLDRGTRWSELRRSHGYGKLHSVRYWCLGNEEDGPWQIGQLQAREYGRKTRDAAKQMRSIHRELRLIACGSSGTFMPTYLTWDREVLEECYDQVDGLSLHAYYGNTKAWSGNSTARYLAMNLDMDRHIHEIAAVCDYVQGLQRSSKRLWLSFDEWNGWCRARDGQATNGRRAASPRGGLQPRGCPPGRRVRQHAAAQFGSRSGGMPGAARQRDRAARDQRDRRAASEHVLPVQLGAAICPRSRGRSPRRIGYLSDQPRGIAGRFRARRQRAIPDGQPCCW